MADILSRGRWVNVMACRVLPFWTEIIKGMWTDKWHLFIYLFPSSGLRNLPSPASVSPQSLNTWHSRRSATRAVVSMRTTSSCLPCCSPWRLTHRRLISNIWNSRPSSRVRKPWQLNSLITTFNSLWPSDVIWWQGSRLPDGTKPLPGPVLINDQWGVAAYTW